MLKYNLKRLLAAVLCVSIIAPMIPELQPVKVKAAASSDTETYELNDSWIKVDKVHATNRIGDMVNAIKGINGSCDVASILMDYIQQEYDGCKLSAKNSSDNDDQTKSLRIGIWSSIDANIVPIRISYVSAEHGNEYNIGAIDVLGYKTNGSGCELLNIGVYICGLNKGTNFVKAYYKIGNSASTKTESMVSDIQSYRYNDGYDYSQVITEDKIKVWIKPDLFKSLYGEDGINYMNEAGYDPNGKHVDDPLKKIYRLSEFRPDSKNSQVLTGSISYDAGQMTGYSNGLENPNDNWSKKDISVVVGGQDSDIVHIGADGKVEPVDNDGMYEFRRFANKVLAVIGNSSDRNAAISNWSSPGCFICTFIKTMATYIADWDLDPNTSQVFSNRLDIFDDFHMVEYFMYYSINYCNGNDSNPPTSVEFSDANSSQTKTVDVTDIPGMFGSLNSYKQAALARTYTSLIKGARNKTGDYFFDCMYIKDNSIGSFEYDNSATGGSEPNIDEEILEHDVKQFDGSEHTASYTPIDVARYADLLARYCYITSAKYKNGGQKNSNIYSAELEILGSDMWSIAAGSFKGMNNDIAADMVQIPQDVKSMEGSYGWLLNDSVNGASSTDSGDYAFNRMSTIFYGVSYAFLVTARSEFANEQGYTPADLRKWLRGDKSAAGINYTTYFKWLDATSGMSAYEASALLTKTDFQSDGGDINLWMFQCILSLHDLCETFDIDPATWNQDIYEYYMIYEDNKTLFEALRQNPVFMGIGYTGGNTARNPLGNFFSITDKTMSDNWMRGFALSSNFTPMVTNLYDASTYDTMDDGDWMTEFFYRYGFHRKALYISTDPNIVVNSKVGRTSSNGRKVCTLQDLLNYDRDIELYIDTGFYNADDIEEGLGRVDYATIRSMVEEQALQSTQGSEAAEEQQASQSKGADDILKGTMYNRNYVDETLNLDTASLLKDDGVTTYSTDVAQHVTKFGETADLNTSLYDAYVLSADSIVGDNSVFDLYQYSALLGYGVVSAIYRDTQMFNTVMASTTSDTTVLRSSKNIIMTEDSTYKDWMSYFNYLMLGNLEKQMNVNVDSLLDLNAPIFIDLFGNIVTESGYVIIPAAANPTLCGLNWNPYCVGFASYLNNLNEVILTTDCTPQFLTWITGTDYKTVESASIEGETAVEVVDKIDNVNLDNYSGTGGWFIVDKHGRVILKDVELTSNGLTSIVSWSTLNAHSDIILRIFWSNAYYNKAMHIYNAKMIMLTTEVLRGAPVETIDYETEGLTNVAKGDAGIVIAYALDNIFEAITSRGADYVNSMLTMPNLALQPYLKYIIYFGIKICVLIMVLLLMFRLFRSGVNGNVGFKAVISFVFTTVIVASAIYILPSSIRWSYDNANAKLLSTEACDIVLYDAMRSSEGQQIGITNVEAIEECTELYMEVGKVHVNWQNVLTKGILSNEYTSFQDIFDDAMKEDPMANQWGVTNKGSSLYMSTRDIYNSTRIIYNSNTNTLSNKLYTTGNIAATGTNAGSGNSEEVDSYSQRDTGAAVYSFVSPYYAFLDMIVADINNYNQTHDIKSYNFSADKYGGVITYDVASPYLLSDEFLYDGYDILGLYQIMRTQQQKPSNVYIFTAEDIARMSMSEWYDLDLTEEMKVQKIEQVYDYARSFVSDHRAVLKHIPDSMFIKALAFACAVKYNQVFSAPHADSVKMIQVDNRDIMRFMLGDFYTVYSNYPYSFGRFVYKSAGTAGVLLSLILSVIILVSNVIKPVLIAVMFVLIILNICFRELLLNKPNRGVEGYFIGCGLFVIINLLYALLLKLAMIFANTGYPVVLAIVVAIIVQLLYMAALMFLIWVQLSEWKDLGYGKMHTMMMQIGGFINRSRYGRGYGGYGGYGSYGGYGGYGYNTNYGYGYQRRGFGRRSGYDQGENPVIDVQVSRQEEIRRRRVNEMRTVDDMYARDEERYNNAFRRRGRR